jgi:hypothetical protein
MSILMHVCIAALSLAAFVYLLPKAVRQKKQEHYRIAQSTYYELLNAIERCDYPNDLFWIERQIAEFESYFMELIDRDTHIKYYNDLVMKAGRKERELLTRLGMRQLN